MQSKFLIWFRQLRPQFFGASFLPVTIGTAIAYANTGNFNLTLFIFASLSIIPFQAGANIANDYFDHISKNDWLNKNKTPFSGGSGLIQKYLLTPKEVFIGALIAFFIGSCFGLVIVILTKSLFVLLLGIIGLLGGYFYTAPPLKLGYRTAGEIVIAFLFGILPIFGSFYIQTLNVCFIPILPSVIVAILIFLVIFANEFPDFEADKAVSKKTLVVTFGIKTGANFYKAILIILCILAIIYSIISLHLFASAILLMPIIGISAICFINANADKLSKKGYSKLSKTTILLHFIGCIALVAAILLQPRTF